MKQDIKSIGEYSSLQNLAELVYKEVHKFDSDVLLTFQQSTEFRQDNWKHEKSYDWLKDRIGYYPVWTMRIKQDFSVDDVNLIIQSTLSHTSPYIFLINPELLETLDTYLYAWCDIHSIEKFGYEEPGDFEVKERYAKDWRKFLLSENYPGEIHIQTLVKEVKPESILKIFSNPGKSDRSLNRLSLF